MMLGPPSDLVDGSRQDRFLLRGGAFELRDSSLIASRDVHKTSNTVVTSE